MTNTHFNQSAVILVNERRWVCPLFNSPHHQYITYARTPTRIMYSEHRLFLAYCAACAVWPIASLLRA